MLRKVSGEVLMSRDWVPGLPLGVYKLPLRLVSFSLMLLSISSYLKLTKKEYMRFLSLNNSAFIGIWRDPMLPKIPVRFLMSLLR